MRIKNLLKMLTLLLVAVLWNSEAKATHLYGSEFTYEYIGPSGNPSFPFQYRVIYKIYRGNNAGSNVQFRFFEKSTGAAIAPQVFNNVTNTQISGGVNGYSTNFTSQSNVLQLPTPPGCAISGLPSIILWTYDLKVNLPISFDGYYVTSNIGNRNNDITNLLNPGGTTLFSYMQMPSPLIPSKSPVFTDTSVVVMFAGDTTSIINSAFDANGDKLIYSFNQPFNSTTGSTFIPSPSVPTRIAYANSNYSLNQPFGPGGYAKINASTGLATYYAPQAGNYVISFQIQEWRNINGTDVLIGTTIRDIQLVVKNVPASNNTKPEFTHTGPKVITITEGAAIPTINFTFTDPNPGQLLTITVNSPLLDGPGGKNASFNAITTSPAKINNAVSGVTGTFNYTSVCGEANTYPLDITVADNACPPGNKVESFQIVVLPYRGPDIIFGDTVVCNNSNKLYNITGKASASYNWKLQGGGTLIGNLNNDSIRVLWNAPGRYKLTAIETNTGNCRDSVSFFVNVSAAQALTVSPTQTICAGNSATLTASGGTSLTWTDGTNTFTGASINVTPAATTTYTVTGASTPGGCIPTNTVQVVVNPLPVIQPGANRAICIGDQTILAASGAATYSWTDGTNTFTGNNVAVSPTATTTYTVTGTSAANCSSTAQVTITVNPIPVVSTAFLPNALCKNDAAVTLPAGSTVNGVAASSLNPATLAVGNATVVLSTTVNGCTGTGTKVVAINAVPAPTVTGLAASYCLNDAAVTLASSLSGSTFTVNGVTATTINPATLGVGTHNIIVSNTNTSGCTGTGTQTVTIKPLPVANFGTLGTAYCANDPAVSLNVAGSVFLVNGTAPAGNTFNPATLGPGNHTVSVTTTSTPDNCSVSATRTVTVHALPTPSLAFLNNSYCANSPAVTLPTGTGVSYSINGGAFIPGGTGALNPATLTVGSNTIAIRETNANNCTVTTTRTITVNPAPLTDAIAGAISVCPGISGIRYSIVTPRETAYNWTISGGLGTIVSGQGTSAIIVNWGSTPGSATVSAQPQNPQGCLGVAGTLAVNITQILATPQPVGPASICLNQANQVRYVMTNPTAGSTFTWSIPGATIVSNTRGDTVRVTFNTVGTHNIVVQESSTGSSVSGPVNCFGNSAPFPVTILASPNASLPIAGPTSVCENAGNTPYTLTGAPANSTFAWTVTSNGVTTPLTGTTGTVQFNAAAPGQYTLTTTETNAAGCVGMPISKVVTVTPRPVLTQIQGPDYICPEKLKGNLYYVASTPGQTFTWAVTGGTLASANGNDSIYIDFNSTATMEITVTPISATNCPGTPITKTVILDPATLQLQAVTTAEMNDKVVDLTFRMPNNSANRKQIEIFRRQAGAGTYTKIATLSNTQTSYTDNSATTADKVFEYYVASTNECGTEIKSAVHNTMLLDVLGNEEKREVYLRWNSYKGWGGVTGYEIYGKADNGNFEMLRQVSATDTIVTLTKISGRGFNQCFRIKAISSDARVSWSNIGCVTFENPLAFFNIFTPNNDGYNDAFKIENIQLYPGNELQVFNRWGTQVYSKKDYDNAWKGDNLSGGTYYYLLKLKDGRSFKGWVEIVR